MAQDPNHLIWLDMEMTGLNPDTDRIIEIAMIVTDSALETIAVAPVIAIHQPDVVLNAMDEWNQQTHTRSGLIERVRHSSHSEGSAETLLLDFVREHVPERSSPMCGNTICQDRRFMARHMPALEAWFHYRNLDVSTLKELSRRWHPLVYKSFVKRGRHEALADIEESIDELKHYRSHFLKMPDTAA